MTQEMSYGANDDDPSKLAGFIIRNYKMLTDWEYNNNNNNNNKININDIFLD